jgi:hypothetical protein
MLLAFLKYIPISGATARVLDDVRSQIALARSARQREELLQQKK